LALKDFKEYVASKGGGGAEQYIDANTGKIKVESTGGSLNGNGGIPAASAPDVGFSAGPGSKLPSTGSGLRAPGLSMSAGKSELPGSGSAWSDAKEQTSKDVAVATGKDYVPYVEQQYQQAQKEAGTPSIDSAPTIDTPVINPGVSPTPGVSGGVLTPDTSIPGTNAPLADTPAISTGTGGTAGSGNAAGGNRLQSASDMSAYIKELYDAQEAQAKAAAEDAYLAQIAALEEEAAAVPEYYYEAGRQQQGQNALERKAMNERFAASGIGSGTAGQAALAQSAADQNEMGAIRRAEAKAMADIEARRREISAEYQAQVRQAILQNDMARAEALYSEAQRVDNSLVQTAMAQAELDAKAEQQAYERSYKAEQNNLAKLESKAKLLASVGDFSGYKALGYTDGEIAVLKGYWDAENATPVYSGGGGNSGGNDGISASESGASMPLQSAQAISLYGALRKGMMDAAGASYIVESGLANGTISPYEAEFILNAFGE
jgi:hypothetical protein